jgi:hypothetical protein
MVGFHFFTRSCHYDTRAHGSISGVLADLNNHHLLAVRAERRLPPLTSSLNPRAKRRRVASAPGWHAWTCLQKEGGGEEEKDDEEEE